MEVKTSEAIRAHIAQYGGSMSKFMEAAALQALDMTPNPPKKFDMRRLAEAYVARSRHWRWQGAQDNRKGPSIAGIRTAPMPEAEREFILKNKEAFTQAWFNAINPSRERISQVVKWYGAKVEDYDRWLMAWCLEEVLLQIKPDDLDEEYNKQFRDIKASYVR